MDESTSALDADAEAEVKSALDTVMKGRTVLVIAHRLSTILNSDQIILLGSGRILEQGSHSELLQKKGKYYSLVMKSTEKNLEEDEEED